MKDIIAYLLTASNDYLDESMKPLISKWSDPPTALQVLEVLDKCIYGSLANELVILALTTMYDVRCKAEGTTHEQVIAQAAWRDLGRKESKE